MRTIKCDGCNCELTGATAFGVVVGGTVQETFDLCGECREALIDWLASRQEQHTPRETKADGEDPLYAGPKNDKVGYTVKDLEKMLHKRSRTIRDALDAMWITPLKWKQGKLLKVRYYLGGDELRELKKRLGVK